MKSIIFTADEITNLQKLVSDFNSYYGDENTVWNFDDLENQRQITVEMVKIINGKLLMRDIV